MDRTTLSVTTDVKDELNLIKHELKLSNDSDTIFFLCRLYQLSPNIDKDAFDIYRQLRK